MNWGDGNIYDYPLFCDTQIGDLTLAENSPCVGTGQDGANMGALGIGCPEIIIIGCTDDTACNYDATATDSGDCTYPETYFNCDGACITDTDGDGICNELEDVGCQDETACNYNADATDDDSCTYAEENYDCDGNCTVLDECDVCGGDNSSCPVQSSEMAAYYFSSITLDGVPLTSDDLIIARNDSTGKVVGHATYENVGSGYTEVLVYGEMSIEGSDSTFNTDGYMLSGDTPQFYVNDIKAHYVAADGTVLQEIPAFQSLEIHPGLTLNLVGDCNGDMGGAASIDYCAECYGGQTGLSEGWYDTDGDGVLDKDDQCPDVAGTVANNGCPEVTVEVMNELNEYSRTILFDLNKSTIRSESFETLQNIADIMSEYPTAKFHIEGHTDSQGSEAYNEKLSRERAASVRTYLTTKGVAANKLTSEGYGELRPIATNKTAAGRQQNRRVEIKLEKDRK